jgi:hypothetical protein
MQRSDGTGSRAIGAMTGRGSGNCAAGQNRGKLKSGSGRGAGGRGMCGWFNASELAKHSPLENEENLLREQADVLRKQQDEVHRRLRELGK